MTKYIALPVLGALLFPTPVFAFVCDPAFSGSTAGIGATACGMTNTASGDSSVAIGAFNTSNGFVSVAVGTANYSSGDNSVAVGLANNFANVSPGVQATAGFSSVAVGLGNVATGASSSALGVGGYATGTSSISVGNQADLIPDPLNPGEPMVSGLYGAKGDNSIAVGTHALAAQNSGIAIGQGSTTSVANGVSIGSQSIAADAHQGSYTVNGGTIAGTTAAGTTFSVGALNFERQIQNVAAGVVDQDSTDAVNGSQLYAVGNKVKQNTTDIEKNNLAISTLDATVAAQTVTISKNTVDIAKNTANIATLNTNVTAQGVAIGQNTTAISNLETGLATTNTAVASQGIAINALDARVTNNTDDIATNTANIATNTAKITTNAININTLGVSTASALGGGSTYSAGTGVSNPNYGVQSRNYTNVGSAIGAIDNNLTSLNNQTATNTMGINSLQGQVNTLAAGYMGHSQDIAALRQGIQRGYEGTAVAIANTSPAISRDRKFGISAKWGTFRGQNALGAMAQLRLSDNVVLNGSFGGGFRYGGVGGGVGGLVEW